MKKIIFSIAASFAAVLFAASCTPEGDTTLEPNFPEMFDVRVQPGESYTFEITPNQAWTVSIPTEEAGEYFWIDNGRPVYTVGGQEGTYTVTIAAVDREYLSDHSIEVSMTMGEKTEVIGKVTLEGTLDLDFVAYPVKFNEDGSFMQDENGNLLYDYENPVSSGTDISMVIPVTINPESFEMSNHLMIISNAAWSIKPGLPEWLKVEAGEAGDSTELSFSVADSDYFPVEGATSSVEIVFTDYDEQAALFNVVAPAVDDKVYMIGQTIEKGAAYECSADGRFQNVMGVPATDTLATSIIAAEGMEIYTLAKSADGTYSVPESEWLEFNMELTGGVRMAANQIKLVADANEGDARSLAVIFLPVKYANAVSSAADLINGGALKSEYADYEYFQIDQASADASADLFTFGLSSAAAANSFVSLDDYSKVIIEALNAVKDMSDAEAAVEKGQEIIKAGIPDADVAEAVAYNMESFITGLQESSIYTSVYVLTYSDESVETDGTARDVLVSDAPFTSYFTVGMPEWLEVSGSTDRLTVNMNGEGYDGTIACIQIYDGPMSNLITVSRIYCVRKY